MNEEIAVWGDELLEKGDPLGQIIALARMPGDRLRTAQRELLTIHNFDYVVFNESDREDETVSQILAILTAERCRLDQTTVEV